MKFANPAAAVSRRLVESVHARYIEQLFEQTGWDKGSIIEMLLLCEGSRDKLEAAYNRWLNSTSIKPTDYAAGHDALRSFLGMLHAEHDRAQAAAAEVRRRLILSNFGEFITKTRNALHWSEDAIVECLQICGDPAAFDLAFAEWFERKDRPQAGPVVAFANDFIRFLKVRRLYSNDD